MKSTAPILAILLSSLAVSNALAQSRSVGVSSSQSLTSTDGVKIELEYDVRNEFSASPKPLETWRLESLRARVDGQALDSTRPVRLVFVYKPQLKSGCAFREVQQRTFVVDLSPEGGGAFSGELFTEGMVLTSDNRTEPIASDDGLLLQETGYCFSLDSALELAAVNGNRWLKDPVTGNSNFNLIISLK